MDSYQLRYTFPNNGSWKYKGETIEEVLRKDSGYIKDLIMLNPNFCLSEKGMSEAQELTKGFYDKWTKPEQPTNNIFDSLRVYREPYDFDFNNNEVIAKNQEKLNK